MEGVKDSSLYMLQLSDGSLRNGLINEQQMKFTLNINLLFFDELYASAPALLRNHVLFDMSQSESDEEKKALKQVYKDHIRPVLIERNKDIISVAKDVKKSDVKIYLSDDKRAQNADLIKIHGEFIASSEPKYFKSHGKLERSEYYAIFEEILERYATTGVTFWYIPIDKNAIRDYLQRLRVQVKPADFRVADAYRIADEWTNINDLKKFIKTVAFTSMEYHTSPLKNHKGKGFSLNAHNRPIINNYWRTSYNPSFTPSERPQSYNEQEKALVLDLPLSSIANLRLSDILELRKTDMFNEIREKLTIFRLGNFENFNKEIKSTYLKNIDNFRKFISGKTPSERWDNLNRIKDEREQLILIHLSNGVIAFFTAIGLTQVRSEYFQPIALFFSEFAAIWAAYEVKNKLARKSENNVYSSEMDIKYNPVKGTSDSF